MEANDGIGMCSAVVEQLGGGLHGGFGAFCLLAGECTESDEKCIVDSTGVIQQSANDLLEESDTGVT